MVPSRACLTSCGGASLALVGHTSSDGSTIKIPYGVDALSLTSLVSPSFPTGLVKTESDFTVRSVETDLGDECWW